MLFINLRGGVPDPFPFDFGNPHWYLGSGPPKSDFYQVPKGYANFQTDASQEQANIRRLCGDSDSRISIDLRKNFDRFANPH